MKYRRKACEIEATRWFKNGDHPLDDVMRPFEDTGKIPTEPREGKVVRYYRHPAINGKQKCSRCKHIMHDHGWIDERMSESGYTVCPGDYVISEEGETFNMKPEMFEQLYEEIK